MRLAHCWSHARRKLREVFDSTGSRVATEGLRRIAGFYAIEDDIRGASPERRRVELDTNAVENRTIDYRAHAQRRQRAACKSRGAGLS